MDRAVHSDSNGTSGLDDPDQLANRAAPEGAVLQCSGAMRAGASTPGWEPAMRKPNYNMERKDRERAKQAKAAAKLEKRASKGGNGQEANAPPTRGNGDLDEIESAKPGR